MKHTRFGKIVVIIMSIIIIISVVPMNVTAVPLGVTCAIHWQEFVDEFKQTPPYRRIYMAIVCENSHKQSYTADIYISKLQEMARRGRCTPDELMEIFIAGQSAIADYCGGVRSEFTRRLRYVNRVEETEIWYAKLHENHCAEVDRLSDTYHEIYRKLFKTYPDDSASYEN